MALNTGTLRQIQWCKMLLLCKTVAIGIKVFCTVDDCVKFSLYTFYAKVYDWHVAIVHLNGVVSAAMVECVSHLMYTANCTE